MPPGAHHDGAAVGIERGVGNIVDPVEFWTFVTGQGFIALVVGLGGWLIVRERHPLAFVVLLVAVDRWARRRRAAA